MLVKTLCFNQLLFLIYIFQKKYTVNNLLINKNTLPNYMPSGLYKIVFLVYAGEIVSSGIEVLVKVVE